MSGSHDDRPPKLVDLTSETVLAILLYPNGEAHFQTVLPPEKVRETLLKLAAEYGRIAATEGEHVCGPECAPAPGGVIPQWLIEMTRREVDGLVSDLQRKKEPLTTEQIALTFANARSLTGRQHVQSLSVMAAILLQRVVYG